MRTERVVCVEKTHSAKTREEEGKNSRLCTILNDDKSKKSDLDKHMHQNRHVHIMSDLTFSKCIVL